MRFVSRGARRRRALWGGTIAIVTFAVGALLVSTVGRRRAETAAAFAGRATAALSAARRGDTMTWAPDELLAAEHAIREANAERARQDARFWRLPDYTTAESSYIAAHSAATEALALAISRRETAERTAEERLELAGAAVDRSVDLAATIHLGAARSLLLGQARLALAEARVYHREGDYGSATLRADRAGELARRVLDHAAAVASRYADEAVLETWRRWKQETIAWSRRARRPAIVVSKEEHRVTLYVNGEPVKVYRADMGFNWVADKQSAGDGATPEGRYRIVARKSRSATLYYKALLLDYPNDEDRQAFARARQAGELPAGAGIGGLIEIHGEGGRGLDWTRGCVAVANADMDDLFTHVEVGTPVTIVGSDAPGALAVIGGSRAPASEGGR